MVESVLMQVVTNSTELTASAGGSFVPTMGALHEGHLALMRRAGPMASPLVISIFVNPKQFGPDEDWQRYPRTLDADLDAARELGVDVVFAPDVGTIYPPDEDVPVTDLPDVATRPGLEDERENARSDPPRRETVPCAFFSPPGKPAPPCQLRHTRVHSGAFCAVPVGAPPTASAHPKHPGWRRPWHARAGLPYSSANARPRRPRRLR